jgi:hypothetical protein
MSRALFTIDELRAVRRLAEIELPHFVTAADAGHVAVDAAALRGLAVRGLVTLGDCTALGGVRIGGELTRLLGPCSSPRLLAEVEMECAGRLTHVAVAVGVAVDADGPAIRLTELPAGLVAIEMADADPGQVLAQVCRLDEVAEPGTGAGFTVSAEAQPAADRLVLDGVPEAAVRLLMNAGVEAGPARAWVAAVAGRRYAASVSVARRRHEAGRVEAGRVEAGELRWLVAGDGTAWRVEPAAATEPTTDPWPAIEGPEYAMIAPCTRQALYDHLAALTGPAEAAREMADR